MKVLKFFILANLFLMVNAFETDSASQSTTVKHDTTILKLDTVGLTKAKASEIISLNQAMAKSRLKAYSNKLFNKVDSILQKDSIRIKDSARMKDTILKSLKED